MTNLRKHKKMELLIKLTNGLTTHINHSRRYLLALASFLIIYLILIKLVNYNENNNLSLSTVKKDNSKFQNLRLFCVILTQKKDLETKALVVNRTWAKYCDKYFFLAKIFDNTNVTHEIDKPLPILQTKHFKIDNRENLTQKVYHSLRHIYKKYDNYDWYLKADDDTFVFVENLKRFLSTHRPDEPITFGYDFRIHVKGGYHSGGGGYVLSKESLTRIGQKLVIDFKSCPDEGYNEDVAIAKCLRQLNVYPKKSIDELGRERFHPIRLKDCLNESIKKHWLHDYAANTPKFGRECCSEESITYHYVNPSLMQILNDNYEVYKTGKSTFKDIYDLLYKSVQKQESFFSYFT